MHRKFVKRILFVLLLGFIIFFNSVTITLTKEDSSSIEAFCKEWNIPSTQDSIHASFENEIAFLSKVQQNVIAGMQHEEIAHDHFGDVAYYYRNRKGFCYDKAILMEKIFSYYGFPFRHVYLYFGDNQERPSVFRLLKKGTSSHALIEVKTQKGWMALGTNANWLGVTQQDEVLTVGQLRKKLDEGGLELKHASSMGELFWKKNGPGFRYIYGLYSRHGDFFTGNQKTMLSSVLGGFHVLPDYNLQMLFDNF